MIGYHIIRGLMLILAYVYPAFEFFKIVETNDPDIDQLLFWCQYWILVIGITILETIAHIFISWVPMLDEAKLAFFIYLWFHKTKGTTYVYQSLFRPYVLQRRVNIDQFLLQLKTIGADKTLLYWKNTTSRIDVILQYYPKSLSIPALSKLFKKLKSYIPKCQIMKEDETFTPLEIIKRTIWWLLAFGSILYPITVTLLAPGGHLIKRGLQHIEKVEILNWLLQQCEKLGILREVLVCGVVWITGYTYGFFLLYLAVLHKIDPPLKLPHLAITWLFESVFLLICLSLAYFVSDFWLLTSGFSICFHIIPLVNLLGAHETFHLFHIFMALLLEATLICCKYPKYVPHIVVIISVALQLVTHSTKHLEEKQIKHADEPFEATLLPL